MSISAEDDTWQELKVWQDFDGNANVDDGELKTLDEWNIESISVDAESSEFIDGNGNEHQLTSTMTMTDGTERETADVWFQVDNAQRIQASYMDSHRMSKKNYKRRLDASLYTGSI
ncbi:hypothetical protein ACR30L_02070 [Psychromonas sp. PT13]|uniref:hypothetical protein n=1 Tax=Psychromonas sp. PT13 TaxID=3439547 RepID=UPI003EBBB2E7